MGLMNFMRGSYWVFILLVIQLSCQNKQTVKVQAILPDTIPKRNIMKPTEYLYNINLDSFDYLTNKIKWGQSFSDILSKNGVSNQTIYKASLEAKKIFNLKKIKKGNEYTLFFKKGTKQLTHFVYESSKYNYLMCELNPNVSFRNVQKQITHIEKQISGTIKSSLYVSFYENNYPIDLVNLIVDVFAWQIDFFKINDGDSYNIIYTEELVDGKW